MRKIVILYDDVEDVSSDIHSFFKVKSYGTIFYKGKTLKEFIIQTFQESGVDEVIVLSERNDYQAAAHKVHYTKEQHRKNIYIYLKSHIVFEDLSAFRLLIEKLSLLDDDVSVNVKGDTYSFMRFNADTCISFLTNDHEDKKFNAYECEILNNENFLLDISYYGDFIQFLHTNFEVRYFNKIIDKEDYLLKTSHNKGKIKQEYRYFQLVQDDLKMFFPSVFNYTEEAASASYCIEKVNVPDMAVQYVSNTLSESEFSFFLKKVSYFLDKSPKVVVSLDEYTQEIEQQYKYKVEQRYQSLKNNIPLSDTLNQFIQAGTKYDSLEAVYDFYFKNLKKKLQHVKPHLHKTFCHGDLCFSNILYDKRTHNIKFIDPKGVEENHNGYKDPYYDLVKLSHSILGYYDFINYGMFDIGVGKKMELCLSINVIAQNLQMHQKAFYALVENLNLDLALLRVLEASLFLSMLPLHADNEQKVLAFLLRGIQILEEYGE